MQVEHVDIADPAHRWLLVARVHGGVLNTVDDKTQQAFHLKFFEKVNKNSEVPRPEKLYGRW